MAKITVARYIYNYLVHKNIKHVFGYSGGAVLPLLNEFHNSNDIKFIKNSNEQCSGYVAEGYSKSLYLSQPGVIISTSGPGVTNLITPLQNAYSDGTPLLAITAQVSTNAIGTDAFQECDAVKLTTPCTKWSRLVLNENNLDECLDVAYNIAMSPRKGPVHLDIPKDILTKKINSKLRIYPIKTYEITMGKNIMNKITQCKTLFENCKKPLVIAGQGCNNSSEYLTRYSEKFNIPVTTTLHGMGCFNEKNKLSLGMLGMHGSVDANNSVQECDLIIALGTRFDDRTIGKITEYAPNCKYIIHVDNSLSQINKVRNLFSNTNKTLISIESNINVFLTMFYKYCTKKDDWIKKENDYYYNENTDLKGPDVIKCIDKTIDDLKMDRKDIYFTTGVGNHQMWTAQHITWTHPGKMITSGSLGTMGVGVPFAIGSKLANEDKTVICIDGDSSFCMTCSELLTLKENNIPVKIIILNDSRQQMVQIWQKLFHQERYIGTDNINPNFRILAEAYDIESVACYSKKQLDKCIENILLHDKCAIGIFHIEPEMCYPLVTPGSALDNMIETEKDLIKIGVGVPTPN